MILGRVYRRILRAVESEAVAFLEQELAHQRETVVPKLEREIEVLKHENLKYAAALERDRKRVEAETAVYAKQIAKETS